MVLCLYIYIIIKLLVSYGCHLKMTVILLVNFRKKKLGIFFFCERTSKLLFQFALHQKDHRSRPQCGGNSVVSERRGMMSGGVCISCLPVDQAQQIIKQQHLADQWLRKTLILVHMCVCMCMLVCFCMCVVVLLSISTQVASGHRGDA